MNYSDSERLTTVLEKMGYKKCGHYNDADLIMNSYNNAFYVVNGSQSDFKVDTAGGVQDFWKTAHPEECFLRLLTKSIFTKYGSVVR